MHLPRLQISSFPRGRVGNTHLRKEFGCYGISFRRLLAYKFVGENANATIFKNELRNSFRRSAPIKTWTGIKKHTPTPMRIYNIMLLGVRSGGGRRSVRSVVARASRPHQHCRGGMVSWVSLGMGVPRPVFEFIHKSPPGRHNLCKNHPPEIQSCTIPSRASCVHALEKRISVIST